MYIYSGKTPCRGNLGSATLAHCVEPVSGTVPALLLGRLRLLLLETISVMIMGCRASYPPSCRRAKWILDKYLISDGNAFFHASR